jgi:hypothetical protein
MEFLSHPAIVLAIITSFAGLVLASYRRHGHKYASEGTGASTT